MSNNKEKSTQLTKKTVLIKKLVPAAQQASNSTAPTNPANPANPADPTNLSNPSSSASDATDKDHKETKLNPISTNNEPLTKEPSTSVNNNNPIVFKTVYIPPPNKPRTKPNSNIANSNISAKPTANNVTSAKPTVNKVDVSTKTSNLSTPKGASSNPPTKAISIAPTTISKPKADEHLTKSSLDLTIKIYEVPKEVNTDPQGSKEFFVSADDRQVFISLKAKQFNKLTEAQEKWPSWVGRISGKLGASTRDGFILEQGNIQVFEKPVKAEPKAISSSSNAPSENNSSNNTAGSDAKQPTNATPEDKYKLPVTSEEFRQIVKLFKPYLFKGKWPSPDEITKLLSPYKLNKENKKKILGSLIYGNRISRETSFSIETLYFKLLPTWDESYWRLMEEIAKTLDFDQKIVERWIEFIHTMHASLKKRPLPEENIVKEVIAKYQEYLLADSVPEVGLHSSIGKSTSTPLTRDDVHKILATYRQELKKQFFDRYRAKRTQKQLPVANTDTEEAKSQAANADTEELKPQAANTDTEESKPTVATENK